MSAALDAAVEALQATPPDPNWTWWNGLNIADAQRQPQQPTLITLQGLFRCERLEDLALMIAERLEGRPPILKRTVATYEGYDTFPAFSVYAQAAGAEATAAAVYVGCVAVQKTKADELEAAIASVAAGRTKAAA